MPRSVFLNFPLGHQGGGRPFDKEGQTRVIKDALTALTTIKEPGTIIDLPYQWEPPDDETIWSLSLLPREAHG